MSDKVKEGDPAPDFSFVAQDGKTMSLKDYAGSKNLVIYFYPKDFTMGCTAETKAFSTSYEEMKRLGAEVIGISSDTAESHERFAKECGAEFPLVSDNGGKARKAFGVKPTLGFLPGRVTFVIDKNGIIRSVFSSQTNPKGHILNALEVLNGLPKG
ncbi:MAG TPA: peroxiredoxin [Nitrososphaerales archaeon]|nr:peroxiredoxin [Nitrososphaerales archaeon]